MARPRKSARIATNAAKAAAAPARATTVATRPKPKSKPKSKPGRKRKASSSEPEDNAPRKKVRPDNADSDDDNDDALETANAEEPIGGNAGDNGHEAENGGANNTGDVDINAANGNGNGNNPNDDEPNHISDPHPAGNRPIAPNTDGIAPLWPQSAHKQTTEAQQATNERLEQIEVNQADLKLSVTTLQNQANITTIDRARPPPWLQDFQTALNENLRKSIKELQTSVTAIKELAPALDLDQLQHAIQKEQDPLKDLIAKSQERTHDNFQKIFQELASTQTSIKDLLSRRSNTEIPGANASRFPEIIIEEEQPKLNLPGLAHPGNEILVKTIVNDSVAIFAQLSEYWQLQRALDRRAYFRIDDLQNMPYGAVNMAITSVTEALTATPGSNKQFALITQKAIEASKTESTPDAIVARPGKKLIFAWGLKDRDLLDEQCPLFGLDENKQEPRNTWLVSLENFVGSNGQLWPRLKFYDAQRAREVPEDGQPDRITRVINNIEWLPAGKKLIVKPKDVDVAQIPLQDAKYAGLHTILNGWAVAMNLEAELNQHFTVDSKFYSDALVIVNLALAGYMDCPTIYSFLYSSKYINNVDPKIKNPKNPVSVFGKTISFRDMKEYDWRLLLVRDGLDGTALQKLHEITRRTKFIHREEQYQEKDSRILQIEVKAVRENLMGRGYFVQDVSDGLLHKFVALLKRRNVGKEKYKEQLKPRKGLLGQNDTVPVGEGAQGSGKGAQRSGKSADLRIGTRFLVTPVVLWSYDPQKMPLADRDGQEHEPIEPLEPYVPKERHDWNPEDAPESHWDFADDVIQIDVLTAAEMYCPLILKPGEPPIPCGGTSFVVGRLPHDTTVMLTNRHNCGVIALDDVSDLALIAVIQRFPTQVDMSPREKPDLGELLYGVGYPGSKPCVCRAWVRVGDDSDEGCKTPFREAGPHITVGSLQMSIGASGTALLDWHGECVGVFYRAGLGPQGQPGYRHQLEPSTAVIKFYMRFLEKMKERAKGKKIGERDIYTGTCVDYVEDFFGGLDENYVIDEQELAKGRTRCLAREGKELGGTGDVPEKASEGGEKKEVEVEETLEQNVSKIWRCFHEHNAG
ncbi:hypothetical protein EJ08DRAFT_683782 [Tothia fuscella]|uniref:Uncharacterized protein n=1 Tax=Tothia fuscella TaxID=1048955 RepID=A0A9P4TS22_9PEZI|nr:hypothetical protein EJ08DRAFT_683782 [Tothia fuscella]